MELNIQHPSEQVALIDLKGRVDAFNISVLHEQQAELIKAGKTNFIVDLTHVAFMDSAAMAALVSLLKGARQVGGDVILVEPKAEAAMRILSLTKFDRVFNMQPSRNEALDVVESQN